MRAVCACVTGAHRDARTRTRRTRSCRCGGFRSGDAIAILSAAPKTVVLSDAEVGERAVVLGGVVDLEGEIRVAFFAANGNEIVGLPARDGEVLARVDVPARSVLERHLRATRRH